MTVAPLCNQTNCEHTTGTRAGWTSYVLHAVSILVSILVFLPLKLSQHNN